VSGLEVIRKLYHNVTWKGCKLQVEAAKPHYLERLAMERAEPLQQRTTLAEEDSHKTEIPSAAATKDRTRQEPSLPRHLKIKRAYGQESWKVDTKPFHVKDWSELRRLKQKLNEKLQKATQQSSEKNPNKNGKKVTKEKPVAPPVSPSTRELTYLNRAVHIRFKNDDDYDEGEDDSCLTGEQTKRKQRNDSSVATKHVHLGKSKSSENAMATESDAETSAEGNGDQHRSNSCSSSASLKEEEDSGSSSSDSERIQDNHPVNKRSYVWSDDDDDEDYDEKDNEDGGLTDTSSEDESKKNNELTKSGSNEQKKGAYKWSDDDSSMESSGNMSNVAENANLAQSRLQTPVTDQDEPVSFAETAEVMDAIRADSEDLTEDVAFNMTILSQIFPDMQPASKRDRKNDDKNDGSHSTGGLQQRKESTGWATSGQMLRYDPTKQSAEQFVLNDKSKKENDTQELEESSTIGKDKEEKIVTTSNKDKNDSVENVYEQGKLEEVFRKAREDVSSAVQATANNAFEDPAVTTASSGFSFGFDLGADQSETQQQPAGGVFSFSFNVEGSTTPVPEPGNMGNLQPTESATPGQSELDMATAPRKRQRLAFGFPEQELDEFVTDFYTSNDGRRILEDLEGWRQDEALRQEWNQERRVLTLDWKRKRKLALNRKNRSTR